MIVFVTLAETAPRMCVVQAKVYEMQKGKEERSRPGRQCTVDLAESVKKGAMRYCTCCELRLRCPREHCDAIVDQPAAHDQVAGRRHDGGDVRHPRRRKHYCLDTSTLSWNFICIGNWHWLCMSTFNKRQIRKQYLHLPFGLLSLIGNFCHLCLHEINC